MLHSELKVGMKVKANEESNDRYSITKEAYGCEGEVIKIKENGFVLKITACKHSGYIGSELDVEAKYFDLVEEIKEDKMKIELKKVNVDLDFDYGDLLISDKGSGALVMADYPGYDYTAVLLDENRVTAYRSSKSGLLDELQREKFGKVVRVVKASNLKLSEI